jgi:hypothetical protein
MLRSSDCFILFVLSLELLAWHNASAGAFLSAACIRNWQRDEKKPRGLQIDLRFGMGRGAVGRGEEIA